FLHRPPNRPLSHPVLSSPVGAVEERNRHGFTPTRAEGKRPLTPTLSQKERENRPPHLRQSRASRPVAARDAVFPLPAGEGQGEGEPDAANQNLRTDFASSARSAPRGRLWQRAPPRRGASSLFLNAIQNKPRRLLL